MNDVSLREYVDVQLAAIRELVNQARVSDKEAIAIALSASEKALDKAESAQDARLALLNEFRGQAADQARAYMRADEASVRFANIETVQSSLNNRLATIEGRFLAVATVGVFVSIGAAVYAVLR